MTKTGAILEMTRLMKEWCDWYHCDFSKFKIVKSSVDMDPNPGPCSPKTLYITWQSKTTDATFECNIEYWADEEFFGYYNINIK